MKLQNSKFKIQTSKAILVLVVPTLILLAACHGPQGNKLYDPRQVDFAAQYNPLFDGQLYPSLILATNQGSGEWKVESGKWKVESGQSGAADDLSAFRFPLSTFSVSLTAPADNAVLRIVIDSSALNYVTIIQEILPSRGERYTFAPAIKWKYDVLRRLRQPSAVDLTFTCYVNDEAVDLKNLHLNCRSVNECPLSLRAPDGSVSDFRWLFAAYVNEDHTSIPDLLTEILDQGTIGRFAGYQSASPTAVRDQVFAVWYYALSRGIAYSSITCTSNPSPRANVQHIRFFDEVYSSRQANCVDACVFFASILRKIGLRPVIFVEPCHAYLGYYTDKNRKNIALLETTITSWVNFPDLDRSADSLGRLPDDRYARIAKYLSDGQRADYLAGRLSLQQLKLAVARSLFEKASEYDRETYEANRPHFADSTSITFQQLDIEQLRKLVQPIN